MRLISGHVRAGCPYTVVFGQAHRPPPRDSKRLVNTCVRRRPTLSPRPTAQPRSTRDDRSGFLHRHGQPLAAPTWHARRPRCATSRVPPPRAPSRRPRPGGWPPPFGACGDGTVPPSKFLHNISTFHSDFNIIRRPPIRSPEPDPSFREAVRNASGFSPSVEKLTPRDPWRAPNGPRGARGVERLAPFGRRCRVWRRRTHCWPIAGERCRCLPSRGCLIAA